MTKYKYFFGSDFRSIPYLTTINNSEEAITVVTTKPVRSGRGKKLVVNPVEEFCKSNNIEFKYFEMLNFSELNELYNVLDLYVVSSRYEGGPQSIVECAASRTPIVSTDVGIASQILSEESIYSNNILDAKPNLDYAEKMITNLKIPNGFLKFNKLLKEINEN